MFGNIDWDDSQSISEYGMERFDNYTYTGYYPDSHSQPGDSFYCAPSYSPPRSPDGSEGTMEDYLSNEQSYVGERFHAKMTNKNH